MFPLRPVATIQLPSTLAPKNMNYASQEWIRKSERAFTFGKLYNNSSQEAARPYEV